MIYLEREQSQGKQKQGFRNTGVADNILIVLCQINPSGSVFVLYVLGLTGSWKIFSSLDTYCYHFMWIP